MKIRHPSANRLTAMTPFVATLALALTSSAWADDPNPYYVGVSQSFTHDSNVYRAPSAQSDTYWSTGLLAGVDQPFGRQRFYANGNVRFNRFQNQTALNNTSYGLSTALDWSTIERLSGTVSYSANQNLVNYSNFTNSQQSRTRNVATTNQLNAIARWGMVSLLTLEGSYSRPEVKYSAADYAPNNSSQDGFSLGLKYRPSGLLTLGMALRTTRGEYPEQLTRDGAARRFSRNDVDFTAFWLASGQSTVNARLSFGRQTYSGGAEDALSVTSGTLSWSYRPTGKLSFDTSITRDTGLESAFRSVIVGESITPTLGDNSRLTNTLAFNATYLATAKIRLSALFRYSHRSLSNSLSSTSEGGTTNSVQGTDDIRSASLGASYAPSRNWLLACNLGRDSRTASESAVSGALSYPFSGNTASCSAQFTIQ